MGQASPTSAIGDAMAGNQPPAGAPMTDPLGMGMSAPPVDPQLIEQIRTTQQHVDQIGVLQPSLAPMVDAVRQQLRQMLIQVATTAPTQNPSAGAVPTAGL
jgi:hypothetical protein